MPRDSDPLFTVKVACLFGLKKEIVEPSSSGILKIVAPLSPLKNVCWSPISQGVNETRANSQSLTQFMGTLCLIANNTGLVTIVFWALPLLLFASWRQCIEKFASVIWEMIRTLRYTQLHNIIKGLKINVKYKLHSQLNTPYFRYKARNQTVVLDADYLLQNKIEKKNCPDHVKDNLIAPLDLWAHSPAFNN